MKDRLLLVVFLFLLLAGCSGGDRPTKPAASGSASRPSADASPKAEPAEQENRANSAAKAPAEQPSAKSPQASAQNQPAGGAATYHWPPDFKLPLQIHIDVPEPPPEITRPSPPSEEKPAPGEKNGRGV